VNITKTLAPYKESSTCRTHRSGSKPAVKTCSINNKSMGGAQLLEKHTTNDHQFTVEKHGLV